MATERAACSFGQVLRSGLVAAKPAHICVSVFPLPPEIGEKNKITVTDDEVSRAVIERARSLPGREKEVWDFYRSNANALAQLRAPIFEDKVVDFIIELANVTEKKVSKEDLFKDEDAEKSAA